MTDSSADEPMLAERLARAITLAGPIPVSQFMGAANSHYYATRDPLGSAGDFTTAPEISQMFGELIGLGLTDLWDRAGRPDARYLEYGPGRGTLAADALRAMKTVGLTPPVHFIETSPVLREAQAKAVPQAEWNVDLIGVPDDGALLVVANEFFDALPVRQLVKTNEGWRERLVACQDTLFLPIAGGSNFDQIIPPHLRDAENGAILETSPASVAVMRALAKRIVAQGGAAIIVDYGYEGPAIGDTLQAVKGHEYANPFDAPGEQDLTAHVDFGTLAEAARAEDAVVHGPITQADLLRALGIEARAEALANAAPERAGSVHADRDPPYRGAGDGAFVQGDLHHRARLARTGGILMVDYRDAVLDDGPELSRLAARSFTETFGTLYPASDLHAFLTETFGRGLPSHLRDPAYQVRLAFEGDSMVGFAKTGPVLFPGNWGAKTIELHQLYVLGGWQGEGVGPALMDWAIATARDAGKDRIVLSVYVDNIRAQRFYARYGFEEVGAYEFRVGETIDDDRIWSLSL